MDYLFCHWSLGVTPEEYRLYDFPNLKHRYRKQFILIRHYKKYAHINTTGFAVYKYAFYQFIPDLFQREMTLAPMCGEEAFVSFLKRNQKIVIKPHAGSRGRNIEVIRYTDEANARQLFAAFTAKDAMVCEGFIRQHPAMEALKPGSVNTIRIVSLLDKGEVDILSATLKIGLEEESITDNMSQGGIGAQVDIPTGIIASFGRDLQLNTYAYHPVTGVQIIGMQIPHWEKAIDLIKTAHKRVPQCALYGWDIAITESGVDIVEANSHPGSRIMQAMDGIPKGKKLLPLLKKDRMKEKRMEYWKELERVYKEHCTMK